MKKTVQEGLKKKIRYIKESIMKERERIDFFEFFLEIVRRVL
jgi:hypothetical protein